MADVQLENGYLPIARELFDALITFNFSKRERAIIHLIIRLSYGCGKKNCIIPRQRDFEIMGIGQNHIKKTLNGLIEKQVITRESIIYSLQKDYDRWEVSSAPDEELKKLIGLNLKAGGEIPIPKREENFPKREVDTTNREEKKIETSQKGKFGLPKKGSLDFPKREVEGNLTIGNLLEKALPIDSIIYSVIYSTNIDSTCILRRGDDPTDLYLYLFSFYKELFKKPGANWVSSRSWLLGARLQELKDDRERFIIEGIKAIIGCSFSEFHKTGNFTTFENIFRTREKMERFMGIYEKAEEEYGKTRESRERERRKKEERDSYKPPTEEEKEEATRWLAEFKARSIQKEMEAPNVRDDNVGSSGQNIKPDRG